MPVLKVTLHRYNARAVYRLKRILKIGKITYSGDTITYRVRSKRLWHSVLIPLFGEFHLRSMKYEAVLIIKKALCMEQVGNATPNNLLKLQQSLDRKTNLISPIWRNGMGLKDILDLDWLAGFIEAEGSFYILSNLWLKELRTINTYPKIVMPIGWRMKICNQLMVWNYYNLITKPSTLK